jgi:hypothetical protein
MRARAERSEKRLRFERGSGMSIASSRPEVVMKRIVLFAWMAAVAGCDEDYGSGAVGGGADWNGYQVVYVCSDHTGVPYTYNSGGCNTTSCGGIAHPMVVGCFEDFADPPAWDLPNFDADVIQPLCEAECTNQVIAEADDLGRSYIDDQCVSSFPASIGTGLENCPLMAMQDPDAPVTVTFTPRGSRTPLRASGTVWYGLEPVSSTGTRDAVLLSTTLSAPFTYTPTSVYASLLGLTAGSPITVRSITIDPIQVPLSANGIGTISAGSLRIRAAVTLVERGVPRSTTLAATNPWALQIEATESSFRILGFTDPFGGVFGF